MNILLKHFCDKQNLILFRLFHFKKALWFERQPLEAQKFHKLNTVPQSMYELQFSINRK